MTLISSIVLDAYRESNILSLAATLTDNQNTEALRLYNAIISSLFGYDVGEALVDLPLGNFGRDPNAHYPPISATDRCILQPAINSRLIAVNDAAISIDFPVYPQEGARMAILDPFGRLATVPVTLNGNGRTIDGNSMVVPTEATEWFYRGDKGSWISITNKALTDDNPFPAQFDAMFIILLALRLNPRYGRDLTDLSQSVLRESRAAFIARYINSMPLRIDTSLSHPFMSRQGYADGWSFSSADGFARGRPYG